MPGPSDRTPSEDELAIRFRRLFDRHAKEVFWFFVRKGFSHEDSRELTQEAFLRVYQGLSEFRGMSSERTWIFSITRNVYLNARRHQATDKRTRTEVPLEAPGADDGGPASAAASLADPAAPDPRAVALARERRELLREAIAALPARMRQCVLLRVVHGYKYREIAELLGVSIDTVKSQLHQATARLRRLLGERFGGLDRLDEGGTP